MSGVLQWIRKGARSQILGKSGDGKGCRRRQVKLDSPNRCCLFVHDMRGLWVLQGDIVMEALIAVQVQCTTEFAEALSGLLDFLSSPRAVTSPEELEALENDIRDRGNRVCGLLVGLQIQQSLDSESIKEAQRQLRNAWSYPLRDKGKETVRVLTATGVEVEVQASYFARKGERRGRKRHPGVYLGLLCLGIHERCTPGLASQVSLLAAMLGSLQEATRVLAERGMVLGIKGVRQIAYRFAERARLAQRLQGAGFGQEVAGRRVAVSIDGGRIRLREKKRGPKTAKGRNRYKGAWREPKLFIVYVLDAEGKLERSFLPVIDALIRRPDALFKLLRGYLEQLGLLEADQVLFIADGAPWIWNRIPALVQGVGVETRTGPRADRLLPRRRAPREARRATQQLDAETASRLGSPTPQTPSARTAGAGGGRRTGDLSRSQQFAASYPTRLLREKRSPHVLRPHAGTQVAHRQRLRRERHPTCGQSTPEGALHLLVQSQRRGHSPPSLLLESRQMEPTENPSQFRSSGCLCITRNSGMRPQESFLTTVSAILEPMASDAVAAGEGALQTCRMLASSTMQKSSSKLPSMRQA
jgi:hypothetical protein